MNSPDFGEAHEKTFELAADLANMYKLLNMLEEAFELYTHVLDFEKAQKSVQNHDVLLAKINLADVCARTENLGDEARQLIKEVTPYINTLIRNRNSNTILLLADVCRSVGEYDEAINLYQVVISEGWDTSPYSLMTRADLAHVLSAKGNYEQAIQLLQEAIVIVSKNLSDHVSLQLAREELVDAYIAACQYEKAIDLGGILTSELLRNRGVASYSYMKTIKKLAYAHIIIGQYQEGIDMMLSAFDNGFDRFKRLSGVLSVEQREQYWNMANSFDPMIMALLKSKLLSSHNVGRMYTALLKHKALELELQMAQRQASLIGRYPHLREGLNRRAALYHEEATLLSENNEANSKHLSEIHTKIALLEKHLSVEIPEIAEDIARLNSTRQAVSLSLQREQAVLIEYFRYIPYNFNGKTRRECWRDEDKPCYVAFVIHGENIWLEDLGKAEPIDALIATFQNLIGDRKSADNPKGDSRKVAEKQWQEATDKLSNLYSYLIQPLTIYLDQAPNKWFIAPDNQLAMAPFKQIVKQLFDASEIEGVLPSITYLTTGRDLCRLEVDSSRPLGVPVVVGDPNFNLALSTSEGEELDGIETVDVDADRSFHRSGHVFDRLIGSHLEVHRIQRLLGVKAIMGDDAVVDCLTSITCAPSVLHLAVHEWYTPKFEVKAEPNEWKDKENTNGSDHPSPNPYYRSGIALAGANTYQIGNGRYLPKAARDGIATSMDMSLMNLHRTIVILALCISGRVISGNGPNMLGLRTALTVAGASAIVLSLWPVDDLATAILMERFYKNLVAQVSVGEALHLAQEYLRSATVKQLEATWFNDETISELDSLRQGIKIEEEIKQLIKLRRTINSYIDYKDPTYCPYASEIFWAAFVVQGDAQARLHPSA